MSDILTELGHRLGMTKSAVDRWITKGVPIKQCVAIEQTTNGAVTRRDLRPKDWHLIWPELAEKVAAQKAVPDPKITDIDDEVWKLSARLASLEQYVSCISIVVQSHASLLSHSTTETEEARLSRERKEILEKYFPETEPMPSTTEPGPEQMTATEINAEVERIATRLAALDRQSHFAVSEVLGQVLRKVREDRSSDCAESGQTLGRIG
jgi:DNA-binding transcriptional regulator YdaS (Cro superfamily)